MKIKMLSTAAGPMGVFSAGVEYDIPGDLAQQFIKSRAAVEVKERPAPKAETAKLETASEAPQAERATDKATEAAKAPAGKETRPAAGRR